ncbi:hypothetical protein ACIPUC_07800 [Streptomyces sp. LARHCF249]
MNERPTPAAARLRELLDEPASWGWARPQLLGCVEGPHHPPFLSRHRAGPAMRYYPQSEDGPDQPW